MPIGTAAHCHCIHHSNNTERPSSADKPLTVLSRACTHVVIVTTRVFVRSPAAVTSLAKFGASCDDLLHSIVVLLDR